MPAVAKQRKCKDPLKQKHKQQQQQAAPVPKPWKPRGQPAWRENLRLLASEIAATKVAAKSSGGSSAVSAGDSGSTLSCATN